MQQSAVVDTINFHREIPRDTGDQFTIYYLKEEAGRSEWVQIGAAKTVVMTDPILVGIGVCAHQLADLATGTFSNVTISPMAVTSHAEGYQYYK